MNFGEIGRWPIATAAVATGYFERTQILRGEAVVRLGAEMKTHLQAGGGLTYEAIKYSTTVRNYTLENVVLDADTLLLIKDGVTIRETAHFVPSHKSHEPAIDNDALIRLSPDEDIIVGYNNAHPGYQHWLAQCVPAFDWSLRQKRNRPVRLLMPALQPWQEDFLRILGHDTVPRLRPEAGKQYLLPRVEYSEYLNGTTAFSICLSLLETAQRILKALPSFASDHKIIYVPCVNPYYGSVANEAEVQAFVRSHGILVLDQKNLDTATRINLFRHADMVMGPHGQGLTDVLFCRPGTVLWEWTPRHLRNASINRLAQAAGAHYHGDMFDGVADPERRGSWVVDIGRIARGLAEFRNRPTHLDTAAAQPATAVGQPIDDLMLAFESLGDNCEFGLIQRYAGVEPLGLLRFAGMIVSSDIQIAKLVDAVERRFEGLGAPGTIAVYLTTENGEFMARESVYNLQYHTGMHPNEISAEELQVRETKRLNFLRRKFSEDLEAGEKIWVWQSATTTRPDEVLPLLNALRAIGPNKLLWVVSADDAHKPGTAERLERDFFKGYVERFASLAGNPELSAFSWIGVCQGVYDLCFPPEIVPTPVVPPMVPVGGATEQPKVNDVAPPSPRAIADDPSPRTLSAMEFLAQNRASIPANPGAAPISQPSGIGGLLSAAFRRVRGQRR